MAALAPLVGPATSSGPALAPQRPAPLPAPSPTPGSAGFTAFPPSYGAFGNSDAGFGTVGVKNGSLTVVPSTPAADPGANAAFSDPPPNAGAPQSSPPGDPPKSNDPPPGDPPPPLPPVATLPPQPLPKVYGLQAPPLGVAASSNDLPGPFSEANQQNLAPDPQQHSADLRAAAQQAADQAQADAAATAREKLTVTLQDVTFRVASANGTGDTSAAEQLSRTAVQINGALNNQIWAGIGTSPPPAFAKPEIPTVFLNFPA